MLDEDISNFRISYAKDIQKLTISFFNAVDKDKYESHLRYIENALEIRPVDINATRYYTYLNIDEETLSKLIKIIEISGFSYS